MFLICRVLWTYRQWRTRRRRQPTLDPNEYRTKPPWGHG